MLMDMCMDSSEESWAVKNIAEQPLEDHLSLWIAVLRKSFPALSCTTISPHILYVFLHETNTSEAYQAMRTGISATLRSTDKLLLPIHCEAEGSHPEGHWTLLVLESSGKVRYYETMNEENDVCLRRARELVQALGLSPDLVKRENKFRQQGSDCGWWVMHYCEFEVRKSAMEGWGGL